MQPKSRHANVDRAVKTICALNRKYGITASDLKKELGVSHVSHAMRWIDAVSVRLPVAEIGERKIQGNNKTVIVYKILD